MVCSWRYRTIIYLTFMQNELLEKADNYLTMISKKAVKKYFSQVNLDYGVILQVPEFDEKDFEDAVYINHLAFDYCKINHVYYLNHAFIEYFLDVLQPQYELIGKYFDLVPISIDEYGCYKQFYITVNFDQLISMGYEIVHAAWGEQNKKIILMKKGDDVKCFVSSKVNILTSDLEYWYEYEKYDQTQERDLSELFHII